MTPEKRLESVLTFLPKNISAAVSKMSSITREDLREIHLRANRPLCVEISGESFFLSAEGILSKSYGLTVSCEDIYNTINAVFRNSFYSYRRELTAGYITVAGGCRVGFCGSAVLNESKGFAVENVKDISSVNIRITHEIIGCARDIYDKFGARGMLIAGGPCSGKTTYLRDLTRLIGNTQNVTLIDERSEIAGVYNGTATNDVGAMTDIFTSYNKYEAIMSAVRSMNPKVIVCDEIGSEEDLRALTYAVNSGVHIIASCHCRNIDELCRKPVIRHLIDMGAFDAAVLLKNCAVSSCRELRKVLCSS